MLNAIAVAERDKRIVSKVRFLNSLKLKFTLEKYKLSNTELMVLEKHPMIFLASLTKT